MNVGTETIGLLLTILGGVASANAVIICISWKVARYVAHEKTRHERLDADITAIKETLRKTSRAIFGKLRRVDERVDTLHVHVGLRRAPSQPDLEEVDPPNDPPNGSPGGKL